MLRDAVISACGRYRYVLRRVWDAALPLLVVIGLNPSTADALNDDPTIRRCVDFARRWGFGGLVMLNLYAWRGTDPDLVLLAADPVGPENDAALLEWTAGRRVLCAWGGHKSAPARAAAVLGMLRGRELVALRVSAKTGAPWHPLYVPALTVPVPFGAAS